MASPMPLMSMLMREILGVGSREWGVGRRESDPTPDSPFPTPASRARASCTWSTTFIFAISMTPRVHVTSPSSSVIQITDRSRFLAMSQPAYKTRSEFGVRSSAFPNSEPRTSNSELASELTHPWNSSAEIHSDAWETNWQQYSWSQVSSSQPARMAWMSMGAPSSTAR